MPLSTQLYKWIATNLILGVTLWWISIPPRGEGVYNSPSHFILLTLEISTSLMGHILACTQISPFTYSLAVACPLEDYKRHSVVWIEGFSSHAVGWLFCDFICRAIIGHISHVIVCLGIDCGHAVVILGFWSVYVHVAMIWLNPGFSACQCNGHSRCTEENRCGECKDNTDGKSRMVPTWSQPISTRCELLKRTITNVFISTLPPHQASGYWFS